MVALAMHKGRKRHYGTVWRRRIRLRHLDAIREGAGESRHAAEEQDAIASQILASLADEKGWKKRFAEKRDVIRRMAREALAEDDRGETLPLNDLL